MGKYFIPNRTLVLRRNKVKKFLKRMLKGLGFCTVLTIIVAILNIMSDLVYAFNPILWLILMSALILFCGYQLVDEH